MLATHVYAHRCLGLVNTKKEEREKLLDMGRK
jgi:hypothetical protein